MDISEHLEQFYLEFYDTCELGANIEARILYWAYTNMLTSEEIKTLLNMGRKMHASRLVANHDSVWWEPITDTRSNNNVSS